MSCLRLSPQLASSRRRQPQTQAAAQGNTSAQHSLGLFYLNGTGVEQNDEEALKYIRMAVEQGNPEAMTSLGYCYS